MNRFLFIILLSATPISGRASWWVFNTLVWNKTSVPHTLHLSSDMNSGTHLVQLAQNVNTTGDTLIMDILFMECGGQAAIITWDSLIPIPSSTSIPCYHLVLRIGYDSNTVLPNCYIEPVQVIDTQYLGYSCPNPIGVENFTQAHVKLFPNPVINEFELYLPPDILVKEIIIYSIYGNIVDRKQYHPKMNIEHLSKGVYYLEIHTDRGLLHETISKL